MKPLSLYILPLVSIAICAAALACEKIKLHDYAMCVWLIMIEMHGDGRIRRETVERESPSVAAAGPGTVHVVR